MAKLRIDSQYGIIPNHLLNHKDITLKSKGLFGYLQSKPDNWNFSAKRISYEIKDGQSSIQNGLKELEKYGYLQRNRYQDDKGYWQVEYTLYDKPNIKSDVENPTLENPTQENPTLENPTQENPSWENHQTYKTIDNKTISNKNINKLLSKDNKETKVSYIENGEEKFGNKNINDLQNFIKTQIQDLGLIYKKGKYERQRLKNILQSKDLKEILQKTDMELYDFVKNIIYLSSRLDFWNGKINNAETFYKFYAQVYNAGLAKKQDLAKKQNAGVIDFAKL